MIRSYAKLVQIDAEPLLADLGRRDIPGPVTVDLRTSGQEPFLEGGEKSNRIYVGLSAAALLVVAVVAYQWWANPLDTGEVVKITPKAAKSEARVSAAAPVPELAPERSADAPATAPASVPEAQGTGEARAAEPRAQAAVPAGAARASVSGRKRMELEFGQQSWVEIKQANGKILLSQLNQAGTSQLIEGVPPFEVVIGNAANVRLKYDGEPVDLRPHFKIDVARLTLE